MTTFTPVITTQSELEGAWRHLMEPLGFSAPSLWLMLIAADGRPVPQLSEIQEADGPPTPEQLAGFVSTLADLLVDHPGGRWAFLRSRPGRTGPGDRDRRWARILLDACRQAGVPTEVVHLATDDRLVPLPLDDLPLDDHPRSV